MNDQETAQRLGDQDEDMQQLLRGITPRPEPSPEALARAYDQLKVEWRAQVQTRRAQRRKRVWLSAVASTVLMVGALTLLNLQPADQFGATLASGDVRVGAENFDSPQYIDFVADVEMNVDQPTRLVLDNGTDLRLAAGTSARWVAADRLFLHAGEAYVDTHEQADFAVDTTYGRVRDIGTRYMVSLASQSMQVAVREGIAEVDSQHGTLVAQAHLDDTQHEAAVVHIDRSGALETREAGSAPRWDWIHDVSAGYQSRLVSEVLGQIGRDLGKPMVYASRGVQATLSNDQVQGELDALHPRKALELVANSAGLSWQERPDAIVVDLQR